MYFAWELFRRRGPAAGRAIGAALAAGVLALLLAGPQLFPLLEAIPHSAEYRFRRAALARRRRAPGRAAARGGAAAAARPASVRPRHLRKEPRPGRAPRRLRDAPRLRGRRALSPGAPGVDGPAPAHARPGDLPRVPGRGPRVRRELSRTSRRDVAVAGLRPRPELPARVSRRPGAGRPGRSRGRAPRDAGRRRARSGARRRRLRGPSFSGRSCSRCPCSAREASRPALRGRASRSSWSPLLVLARWRAWRASPGARLAAAALALLVAQRFLEMRGTYPTLPASTFAPPLPTLAAIPPGSEPRRVVATRGRPASQRRRALRLEDVRGYESLVLDRFADTYPLWCEAQPASFNRVGDLVPPVSLVPERALRDRRAGRPGAGGLARARARAGDDDLREPAGAAPGLRASPAAPRGRPGTRGSRPWRARRISARPRGSRAGAPPAEENGAAALRLRAVGPGSRDLGGGFRRAFVATSLPDWPGWVAEEGERADCRSRRSTTPSSGSGSIRAATPSACRTGRTPGRSASRPAAWERRPPPLLATARRRRS